MKQSIVWILSMYWLSAAADECEECQGEAPQTKAGVAMLVKTHHAKHVSGIESTEGIEREATLIREVLTSPTAELSQSMVEELAAMRITPEVAAFIQGTLSNLKPVFEDIEEASKNDTTRRDVFLKSFDELSANLSTATANDARIQDEVAKASKVHVACRKEEKVDLDAKRQCDSELAVLLNEKEAAFGILKAKTEQLKGLICNTDVVDNLQQKVDTADPYADAGRKYLKAAEAYKVKKDECDAKTKTYTEKRAECKTKQQTLEQCYCIQGSHAKDECAAYTAGFDAKVEDYNIFLKQLGDSVAKRKFEWKHLKRVACTLQALATHTVEKHDTLTVTINECQSKPFVNDVLDIPLTPAPGKGQCPAVPPLPCSEAYKNKEYSSLPEGCPAHECQPCVLGGGGDHGA